MQKVLINLALIVFIVSQYPYARDAIYDMVYDYAYEYTD